jgi:glycine/D-amino acid oxidase-like deaminating enzyme
VCVIEKDSAYAKASCVLSAGGIRQQFTTEMNIKMSQYGLDFIQNTEHLGIANADGEVELPDMQYVNGGYLVLASSASASMLESNVAFQREFGVNVSLLKPNDIQAQFPWMNTDEIAHGSFGHNEGWFDPWTLLTAMKRKAKSLGVEFIDAEVVDAHANTQTGAVESLHIVPTGRGSNEVQQVVCGTVVNAAGAWARSFMRMLDPDSDFPVEARKRSVFAFNCEDKTTGNCPLVCDPSGVWFRREGSAGNFMCGMSPPNTPESDPHHDDDDVLDCPDEELFNEILWPTIATR